ncbi:MAG: NAD(P)-dependent glycerol-3-phosphate dehydrogenase [Magnetococcus sp. DMHC-6]
MNTIEGIVPSVGSVRAAVIGAGSWGTALASVLAGKLDSVTLWCREAEVADAIQTRRRNPLFVSDIELPANINAVTDLAVTVASHDLLVMVVPTQFVRHVLKQIEPDFMPGTILVSACKGVEVESLTLISQIYAQVLGDEHSRKACYLSGPSFAREVLQRKPTAVSIAGSDPEALLWVQQLFSTPYFRTYRTDDVVGLELGGALKNVIALAAGISDGLEFGYSARAALITRGLAEMVRLGTRLGARSETFFGLSGMGDLLLTATSDLSRNRSVGRRLGAGESLEEIQKGSLEVAEGVRTTHSVFHLAKRLQVEMPITQAVYEILYGGREPRLVVLDLMERQLKTEIG